MFCPCSQRYRGLPALSWAVALLLAFASQAAVAGSSSSRPSAGSAAKSSFLPARSSASAARPLSRMSTPAAAAPVRLSPSLQEQARRRAAALAARAPVAGTRSTSFWTLLALAALLDENGQRASETAALRQEVSSLRAQLPAGEQALAEQIARKEGFDLPPPAAAAQAASVQVHPAPADRPSSPSPMTAKLELLTRFLQPLALLAFLVAGFRLFFRAA
jgi:hypothetical protein